GQEPGQSAAQEELALGRAATQRRRHARDELRDPVVGERQPEVEPGRGRAGGGRARGQAEGQLRVVDRVGRIGAASRRSPRGEPPKISSPPTPAKRTSTSPLARVAASRRAAVSGPPTGPPWAASSASTAAVQSGAALTVACSTPARAACRAAAPSSSSPSAKAAVYARA